MSWRAHSAVLRLATAERGALLWLPALALASTALFFGLRSVPGGMSLYTRATSTRIVVGPWACPVDRDAERDEIVAVLGRELAGRGGLSVVDAGRVRQSLATLGTPSPEGGSWASVLRAVRPLNPHFCLLGSVRAAPGGELDVELELWEPRQMRRCARVRVLGAEPGSVGRALADSVQALVFAPSPAP